MEAILETKKLSHIYSDGTPFERGALVDVDFTAYRGEYLGIIGHTGSGKSTLIQHLNGLLKPTSGQVLCQGKDIWSDPKTTRLTRFQVGLVFQYPEYQLFVQHKNGWKLQIMNFTLRIYGPYTFLYPL